MYCVRFCAPGAPKCCTVCAFAPPGHQSAVLYTPLGPRGTKALYSARFWVPGVPKRPDAGPTRALPGPYESPRVPKVLYCALLGPRGPKVG